MQPYTIFLHILLVFPIALFGNCHIALTSCKIQEKIKSIVEELTDELILSIDVAVTQIIK